MSDDSVQQRIYGPVEKDLDKVVEELLSQSDRIPENTTAIESDKMVSLEKLIGSLEDNDDVQNVYHNAESK